MTEWFLNSIQTTVLPVYPVLTGLESNWSDDWVTEWLADDGSDGIRSTGDRIEFWEMFYVFPLKTGDRETRENR